ncbi:hypothetical protein T492DRAFT_967669 [Pavlovales sp. CCMP2436]|nr:hypothetical protein T492DRAFT_967669 [Pavlovales sp. CCMP2436]
MRVTEMRNECTQLGVGAAKLAAVFERKELEALLCDARSKAPPPDASVPPASLASNLEQVAELASQMSEAQLAGPLAEALRAVPGGDTVDASLALLALQRALSDPEAMKALMEVANNPRAMQAMQDISTSGPAAMSKYENDPEVIAALEKLQRVLQ